MQAKGNPGVIGMPFTRHYAAGASGIAYTEVKYVPGEPEEFWVAYGIQGLVFKAKHEVVGSGAVLQCTLTIEDA